MPYAAYDAYSIYAVAHTEAAAIAKAREDAREPEAQFRTARISDALFDEIARDGWDGNRRSFDVVAGKIIATNSLDAAPPGA